MDDSLWDVDNAAAAILSAVTEAASAEDPLDADDLADIVDEVRDRAGSIVTALAPPEEVVAWHEQTYTEECDGESIPHVVQVPEFAERTAEQLEALIGRPAYAMLVAAEKIEAAVSRASDRASFLAAVEPLVGELASARAAIAPAVKDEQDYHDHLADMADGMSY
jgi:hypothetical protein